jgi:hypothetical protein
MSTAWLDSTIWPHRPKGGELWGALGSSPAGLGHTSVPMHERVLMRMQSAADLRASAAELLFPRRCCCLLLSSCWSLGALWEVLCSRPQVVIKHPIASRHAPGHRQERGPPAGAQHDRWDLQMSAWREQRPENEGKRAPNQCKTLAGTGFEPALFRTSKSKVRSLRIAE